MVAVAERRKIKALELNLILTVIMLYRETYGTIPKRKERAARRMSTFDVLVCDVWTKD